MKLESIQSYETIFPDKKKEKPVSKEVVAFVDTFYDQMMKGTKMTATINLSDSGDNWPTREAYDVLDKIKKGMLRNLLAYRVKEVQREILKRTGRDHPSWLKRYSIRRHYLGSGRVVLYWYLKPKKENHAADERPAIVGPDQGQPKQV